MVANPYQRYQTVAAETASPGQLVVMLYEGAIRFCNVAHAALEQGDTEKGRNWIGRVQAIVEELDATLNVEAGGEIAENLERLYEYMNRQLLQASLKKDPEPVKEVEGLFRELREAWVEMLKQAGPGAPTVTGRTVP